MNRMFYVCSNECELKVARTCQEDFAPRIAAGVRVESPPGNSAISAEPGSIFRLGLMSFEETVVNLPQTCRRYWG
jgi:hypothetical protein